MEGVSNNVAARPRYSATKKGAIIGAGVGVASTGLSVGITAAALSSTKGTSISEKKEFLKSMQKTYGSFVDMSKTTVSKFFKANAKKSLIGGTVTAALFGTGVGLVVDLCKNNKAKKAQKTEA